ncbi:hypothetical protein CEXT_638551, partial [Caerostris extrusa]
MANNPLQMVSNAKSYKHQVRVSSNIREIFAKECRKFLQCVWECSRYTVWNEDHQLDAEPNKTDLANR